MIQRMQTIKDIRRTAWANRLTLIQQESGVVTADADDFFLNLVHNPDFQKKEERVLYEADLSTVVWCSPLFSASLLFNKDPLLYKHYFVVTH